MFALLACSMAAHLVHAPSFVRDDAQVSVTCAPHTPYCDASQPSFGPMRVCFEDTFDADGETHFAWRQAQMRQAAGDCALYVMAAHQTSAQPDDESGADGGNILRQLRTDRRRTYVVYAQDQMRLGTIEIRDTFGLDSARWALTEMWSTVERADRASLHILTGASAYPVYEGRSGASIGHVFGSVQRCEAQADHACVAMAVDPSLAKDTTLMLSALMGMHLKYKR